MITIRPVSKTYGGNRNNGYEVSVKSGVKRLMSLVDYNRDLYIKS